VTLSTYRRFTNNYLSIYIVAATHLVTVAVMCLLHSRYQPVWMTDTGIASNIIMSTISSPHLFVLNPQTHEFYLIDESVAQHPTIDAVADFLDDISNGSRQVRLPVMFLFNTSMSEQIWFCKLQTRSVHVMCRRIVCNIFC